MFKDTNTGQTHYVGDGCNPPHIPLVEKEKTEVNSHYCTCNMPSPHNCKNIIQIFQDYADKNEDENVRLAVKFVKERLKK